MAPPFTADAAQVEPMFKEVPPPGAFMVEPMSPEPERPPGFWVLPHEDAAVVMPPDYLQVQAMLDQAASVGITAPMLQQAPAMATLQPSLGTAPRPPGIPYMMEGQQAQGGYMVAPPPLPLVPPPMMMQQQPPQTNVVMMEQPSQPFGYPPAIQLQQPPQTNLVTVEQLYQPFGFPPAMQLQQPFGFPPEMQLQQQAPQSSSVMMEQPPQADLVMTQQPYFSAPPCKRQRFDQYGMTSGQQQHMTDHHQEMTTFNPASYRTFFQNELPCPPNASSTLFVEGFPNDCTTREVAHIFRHYSGFREARLVNRAPPRQPICFVDFATPAQAFLAMGSLQGYKFDLLDQHSPKLIVQFSHSPRVPASGGC